MLIFRALNQTNMTVGEFLKANVSPKIYDSIVQHSKVGRLDNNFDPGTLKVELGGVFFDSPLIHLFYWEYTPEGADFWAWVNSELKVKFLSGKLVVSN